MKFAVVENHTVVNIAVADEPLADNWIASETAAIGWAWDGESFMPPAEPPVQVPQFVTMRQARLALLSVNLLDDVEAAVAAAGRAAQIEWEYATEVQRTHPLIAAVQQAQGLSDAQIDALFVAAAGM